MKFENCRLAGSVARERQYVADGIIAIPNCVATVGHGSNESAKFIVAIADGAGKGLLRNCERQSITLQATMVHDDISGGSSRGYNRLNAAVGPAVNYGGLPTQGHGAGASSKIRSTDGDDRAGRPTVRNYAAYRGRQYRKCDAITLQSTDA
jgi:hypothetical protein